MPPFLSLQNIQKDPHHLYYYWTSRSRDAVCPFCGTTSHKRCYDTFEKSVQDVPEDGRAVYHVVRCQRYFCTNPGCAHSKFVERLTGFVEADARKTLRFKQVCIARALDSGCKPAEDALKREGAQVSNDSIARYLKGAAAQQIHSNLLRNDVHVLAVDDIYLHKGDKSTGCTVFLDEETHRVLLIVRGTTKAAVLDVLKSFPAATFFSRDRASAYSAAATACGKTQIADRFHVIENAHQAVQDALATLLPAKIFLRDGDGWVPAVPDTGRVSDRPVFTVPEAQVDERIHRAQLTTRQAQKYRHTLKLLELADRGLHSADIAQTLGIPIAEVQSLRRTAVTTLETVEAKVRSGIQQGNDAQNQRAERLEARHPHTLRPHARPSHESIVEPYRDLVIQALQEGGNHRTIHPLLQQQGFSGSTNTVYQYILKLRAEIPNALRPEALNAPAELQLRQISRDTVYKQILKQAADSRPQDPASRSTAIGPTDHRPNASTRAASPLNDQAWALIFGPEPSDAASTLVDPAPEQKKDSTADLFAALVGSHAFLTILVQFLTECYRVFDTADPAALTAFIQHYQACEIGPLARYATGLQNDYEAVKNSLIYPEISNGPLEGMNSRIKMKHRRGAGRAGLELLNAYNVLQPKDLTG